MKIEDAEEIWGENDVVFVMNGHTVSKHKTIDMIEAARTIIAARDQRIAELEKTVKTVQRQVIDACKDHKETIEQRDEARRDAAKWSECYARLCTFAGKTETRTYMASLDVAEKYGDAK